MKSDKTHEVKISIQAIEAMACNINSDMGDTAKALQKGINDFINSPSEDRIEGMIDVLMLYLAQYNDYQKVMAVISQHNERQGTSNA